MFFIIIIIIVIIIIIIIIIIIDHVCYKTWFWGESISELFGRHCLPLLIRFGLIGKPYYVRIFVVFCLSFFYYVLCFLNIFHVLVQRPYP